VYISHLDLMHTFQRVFLRAGYRLKHSEGFNPHPIISIAVPLSVGHGSVCEIMDFTLAQDDADLFVLTEALNKNLPEGIRVLEIYPPETKASGVKWLRVSGRMEYDEKTAEEMLPLLTAFYARPELPVSRKTKRGEGVIDIAPYVKDLALTVVESDVCLEAVVSVNEPTINPELLVKALEQNTPELASDFAEFTRLEFYDEHMKVFR
jgi:radical SAM-linked protein